MRRYINPWALEVVKEHPAVTVCDQWQFVKDDTQGHFSEWWKGKNVHFRGEAADALGRFLARHVLEALGEVVER